MKEHFISMHWPHTCQPFGLKCELNDINGIQKMIYKLMKKNDKKSAAAAAATDSKIHICTHTDSDSDNVHVVILSFRQLDFWINYNEVMRMIPRPIQILRSTRNCVLMFLKMSIIVNSHGHIHSIRFMVYVCVLCAVFFDRNEYGCDILDKPFVYVLGSIICTFMVEKQSEVCIKACLLLSFILYKLAHEMFLFIRIANSGDFDSFKLIILNEKKSHYTKRQCTI